MVKVMNDRNSHLLQNRFAALLADITLLNGRIYFVFWFCKTVPLAADNYE
jgi:hypothetical protein